EWTFDVEPVPGCQGEPGTPGEDGQDGKDGIPGEDGQDGIPGKDGSDGTDAGDDNVIADDVAATGNELPDTGSSELNIALGLAAVALIAGGGALMVHQRRALAKR
ncbi:MAG: LPXTG cell wall anchor domain-containing protein, partial [Jiangellaceae bacterium]